MAEHLAATDGERGIAADTSDRFYVVWGHYGEIRIPASYRHRAGTDGCELVLPAPVLTPFEKDVLEGSELTPAEAREVVRLCVRLKACNVEDVEVLAGWLVNRPKAEIQRRLRSAFYERLAWHQSCMGGLVKPSGRRRK